MGNNTHSFALQASYRNLIYPYASHIQYAVTLTLKMRAKVSVKRFENYDEGGCYEYWVGLNEEILKSTIKRFNARLTAKLFGNAAKHKNKQAWASPLVITVIEGERDCKRNGKRPHLHLAIGNVPEQKQAHIGNIVKQAWSECDFGYKQTDIQRVYGEYGWLNYITKDTGYTEMDTLDVTDLKVPEFIQQDICTESRLFTE